MVVMRYTIENLNFDQIPLFGTSTVEILTSKILKLRESFAAKSAEMSK